MTSNETKKGKSTGMMGDEADRLKRRSCRRYSGSVLGYPVVPWVAFWGRSRKLNVRGKKKEGGRGGCRRERKRRKDVGRGLASA